VLLGYTNMFTRTHQWQNRAQYELSQKEVCGFEQVAEREGEIELVLYYAKNTPEFVRDLFRGLFERFLSQRRNLTVKRYIPVICPACEERQERNVIIRHIELKRVSVYCSTCGKKLPLPKAEELNLTLDSRKEELIRQQAIAKQRTAFEIALVRVKGLLRDTSPDKKSPVCFISYAWGKSESEKWVITLAKDLQNSGIDVLLDRWHSGPGSSISRYIEKIETSDFALVIGTPELAKKYKNTHSDAVVSAELSLINTKIRQPKRFGRNVIPILLKGESAQVFTPFLQDLVFLDFRSQYQYFSNLFELIWRLYELPIDHPWYTELKESM
jgi:hypothetical protein